MQIVWENYYSNSNEIKEDNLRKHVLKRPDTYVGSLDKQTERQWVLNEEATGFIEKTLSYSPALYKIYDQVLVNAADNYQRDKSMDYLNIEINETEGFVRVHNNGKGIPIVIHKENNMYIPQMIFGHLLTGSNFDDQNDQRFGGGRNGFGAKLANILSTKFSVQCGDSQNKKHFYMAWLNNMGQPQQAIVKDYKKKDFVEIVFYPDFKRFGMQKFESDIVQLFAKRAYDMAGVLAKVKVVLNGKQIPIKAFNDYVDMYLGKPSEQHHPIKVIAGKDVNNATWQVILSRSDGQLKQVSFVNSICTYKGGTHVNYILDQIIPKISDKLKNNSIKTHLIKSKLFVFINCLIINPKFDSQLKETLTTRPNAFGSSWQMPEKMIKSILATGIVEQLSQEAEARQMTKMAKVTAGGKKVRLIDVPKLEDANDAGTSKSEHCVLILTEGDSAKALAVSGLSVVGRDKYGVFPLRGKLLNVREKDKKSVLQNAQINNIVKIIGLQYNKQYTDRKSLRYGSIMIMTDQDADGSHIKGLIINFVNYYWPSLFKINGFLRQFITPLLKVTKGQQSHSFFTSQQYKVWSNNIQNIKTWKIKYYKGLGTSTSKQGQQYFSNINNHEKIFRYQDEQDSIKIDMAFSKKKADQRKQWLANYDPEDIIELSPVNKEIQYKHFIDKQLKHFSNSNNRRAIPSLVDGFKPGQRKILFACFKRNLKDEIKVAQLAGYVAEHSAYHHGQMSLTMTIVLLAQNFVGSNNINLLMPNGQFGSRAEGGDDHASARYIFTCLNKITRVIFPEADDHTLKYLEDDGQLVEPQFYVPIIPMILVNGVQGLGTGWATKIPNFNPRQIVQQLKRKINGEPFTKILPWYKDFQGQTVESSTGVTFRGIMSQDSSRSNVLHITQLPVGKWNIQFKQTLNELITKKKYISGYRQYHTQDKVHFQIDFEQDYLQKDEEQGFDKVFDLLKMSTKKSTANMVAFNLNNNITKYQSSVEIMNQYFDIRMQYYVKRKDYIVSKLQREVQMISMKTKFILAVVDNKLEIRNIKKKMICQKMLELGFIKYSQLTVVKSTKKAVTEKKKKNNDESDNDIQQNQKEQEFGLIKTSDFDYLLSMPIWNLTHQKVQALKAQMCLKETELETLKNTKQSIMWLNDLNQFLKVLDEVETQQRQQKLKAEQAAKAVKKVGKQKQGKKIKKKNQSQSQDGSPNKKKDNKKNTTQVKNQNKKQKNSESTSKADSETQKQVSENSLTADTPFKQLVRSGRQEGQKRNKLNSKLVNNLKSKSLQNPQSFMFKQPSSNNLFTKAESKQQSKSNIILKKNIQNRKQKQAKNKVMKNRRMSEDSQEKEQQ